MQSVRVPSYCFNVLMFFFFIDSCTKCVFCVSFFFFVVSCGFFFFSFFPVSPSRLDHPLSVLMLLGCKTVTCPADPYQHLAGVGNHVTLPLFGLVFQCLVRLTVITQKQIFTSDTKVPKSLLLERAMLPTCMESFVFLVFFFFSLYTHAANILHTLAQMRTAVCIFVKLVHTFAHQINVIICYSQSLA